MRQATVWIRKLNTLFCDKHTKMSVFLLASIEKPGNNPTKSTVLRNLFGDTKWVES
ncbi:hypothetical protein ALT785_850052 [Alteromonas infernus]